MCPACVGPGPGFWLSPGPGPAWAWVPLPPPTFPPSRPRPAAAPRWPPTTPGPAARRCGAGAGRPPRWAGAPPHATHAERPMVSARAKGCCRAGPGDESMSVEGDEGCGVPRQTSANRALRAGRGGFGAWPGRPWWTATTGRAALCAQEFRVGRYREDAVCSRISYRRSNNKSEGTRWDVEGRTMKDDAPTQLNMNSREVKIQ